jgi:hypothetical protein
LQKEEKLKKEDEEALIIAAYFHNVGYQVDATNHEELAANKCGLYLLEQKKRLILLIKLKP